MFEYLQLNQCLHSWPDEVSIPLNSIYDLQKNLRRQSRSGGSAGLIYGYLFVWLGIMAVFTTMAELASM